jgi:hypothetical protein
MIYVHNCCVTDFIALQFNYYHVFTCSRQIMCSNCCVTAIVLRFYYYHVFTCSRHVTCSNPLCNCSSCYGLNSTTCSIVQDILHVENCCLTVHRVTVLILSCVPPVRDVLCVHYRCVTVHRVRFRYFNCL